MLSCKDRGALVYVGLAVMQVKNKAALDAKLAVQLAVVASCLLRFGDSCGLRASALSASAGPSG